MIKVWLRTASVLTLVFLAACQAQDPNKAALEIGAPPAAAVAQRALEARRYGTADDRALLAAATQTLQDLGFTITESAAPVGVLVGSKQRDATEAKQVVGAILVGALLGVHLAVDTDQTINVTLVATPIEGAGQVEVRVAFDRTVRSSNGAWRAELLQDPALYQQFFQKLSAGVQMEAQAI